MRTSSRHPSSTIRTSRQSRSPQRALIESLEARTLLSVTIVNAKLATFTDVDGDTVIVSVSKGTLTEGLFTTAASGDGEQLQLLNLTAAEFAGANLTISVRQAAAAPLGDGLTNVGYINATGRALGKVSVAGDLGQIDAGSGPRAGVNSLTVFSLGRQGLATQAGGGSLVSDLTALGSLNVTTDVQDAFVNVAGNVGTVRVGGSLIGGNGVGSGSIQAGGDVGNVTIGQNLIASDDPADSAAEGAASIQALGGKMGNVTIGGAVVGGTAEDSASIFANTSMGKVSIGGDLRGSDGEFSAEIEGDTISSVTIYGSVIGGAGASSGFVLGITKLGNVYVGGSVFGGSGDDSGAIASDGDLGKVTIVQSLIGGDANSATAFRTGYVEAFGKIASVFVGGSIFSGANADVGALTSGSIRADETIGSITINGSLVGNNNLDVIIAAGGPLSGRGNAIGSITIAGQVSQARILAGYDTALAAVSAGAQLGKVTIFGDWIASSIVAGTTAGVDTLFGTADDAVIGGAGAGTSKIASIIIYGQVFGTAAGGDHFGFVASQIGSFSAAGVKYTLTRGIDVIDIGGTDDVTLREVPLVV